MSLQNRYFRVEYANGFDAKNRVLTSGRDFRLEFDPPGRYFTGRYFIGDLSPRIVDLLRIGEAIFVVDRHVRRRRGPVGSWSRSLNLGIELLEPNFWSSTEVLDALQQTVVFLRRMSRLATHVAGRQISFRLPFLDRTKGEMVRSLNDAGLSNLARKTISCASYPVGYHKYKQCGLCPGCLFRRQAMMVGDIDEPPGTYSFDLFGRTGRVQPIPPEKLNYLKAFLMQVAGWTAIEITRRLPGAVERHLRQTRILKPGESPE